MALTTLIEPDELAGQLDNPRWAVIDCRFSLADPAEGSTLYQASHLPGSRYAHLDQDLSSPITPTSGRHPLPDAQQFCRRLGEWGIDDQAQVVAYDDSGGAFAARLWWLLRWVGHANVAVLNGGYSGWTNAGLPTTGALPTIQPVTHACRADRNAWMTAEDVEQSLQAEGFTLIDAREPQRYRGEVEPIDPIAGHVPGAVNLPFKQNVDETGRFLPPEILRQRFVDTLGDPPFGEIAHMCGSGVTACHNLLAMQAAGLPSGRLYAGSWSEWIRDAQRPVTSH